MVKRENVKVKWTFKTTHMVFHTNWVTSIGSQPWPQLVQSYQLSCSYLVIYNSSVQFSRSVVSGSLQPHESQHARPPCHHQLPEFTQTHIH